MSDHAVFLSTLGGELVDLANQLEAAQRSRNWTEVDRVNVAIARMSIKVLREAKQLVLPLETT